MNDVDALALAGEGGRVRAGARAPALRGAAVLAIGATAAFLTMAHDARLAGGVPLGAACIAAATWGALDLARARDHAPAWGTVTLAQIAPWLAASIASLALFAASLAGVSRGAIPQWLGGAALVASYVAIAASVFRLGEALGPLRVDEVGLARPLLRRHGFWLLVLGGLLYLPTLGASSLWDPWETHYGEVAREILVRDDWISFWWAHQGFFYSKPALVLWADALSMAIAGVDVRPGHVLLGGAHPEWAVRMPHALSAILAVYILYKGAAKAFGRRAALLGGIALLTMPTFFLLAQQAQTDMAFVATMSAAMGLLLLGLHTPEDARVREHEVRVGSLTLRLSAWHLCFGAIVACALPQAIYLVSRNVELVLHAAGAHGFRVHADEFRIGSGGGNCAQAGNIACGEGTPAHPLPPFVQGLAWMAGLAMLLWTKRDERRARRLYFVGAWLFAALATLAKGPAGLGLPVLCVLAYIAATKRWSSIFELEIASGALVVAVVALPWYVAAYVRHGTAFTDELLFHDMIDRAFSHVHDTNEGDDTSFRYYLNQLGYGLFPWTGLAPIALAWWMRDARRSDASIMLFMWFLFAFALFAVMGTKFHHYIFPALPPIALLVGVMLDDWIDVRDHGAVGVAALAGAVLVALVARDLAGEASGAIRFAQLFSYQYKRPWPSMLDFRATLTVFGALAAVVTALFAARRTRKNAVIAMTALAACFATWGAVVYLRKTAPHWGQGEVIRAYYESRASDAEPIVAYQMNWKGEAFYTGNRMATFVSSGAPFTKWLKEERDHGTKVVYFVLEPSRLSGLKGEAQARAWREVSTREQSHQFVLVRAEL